MISPLSTPPVALTLSGGVWLVMGVFVVGFFAIVWGYFTEKGTEIRFHAWGNPSGDAPGSLGTGNVGKDPTVDVRMWMRGTSSRRGRNIAKPRADRAPAEGDPEMLARLAAWRDRLSSSGRGLIEPPDPSRDHLLGRPDGPVQLVEYADFECPSCQAVSGVLDRVRKRLGDDLVIVFRHFPVVDAHPAAMLAAEAGEAAGAQGRFWEMYGSIYRSRRPPTSQSLRRHAARLKLDVQRFESELRGHVHAGRIREDFDSGLQSGVNGTPTFFVNGTRHEDEHTVGALLAALEGARSQLVAPNAR